jgi:hypothetical protein
MFRFERGLKPLPNEYYPNYHNINLTTNYQLLLNCKKVHRAVANLKLCVYYLKHMERVHRQPISNAINLVLVRSYHNQQCHEVGLKKTAEEPEINDKD